MLNTLTTATFKHRGYVITAKRTVNSSDGKFFCWYGEIEGYCTVAARTIQQFEKQFMLQVDMLESALATADEGITDETD